MIEGFKDLGLRVGVSGNQGSGLKGRGLGLRVHALGLRLLRIVAKRVSVFAHSLGYGPSWRSLP